MAFEYNALAHFLCRHHQRFRFNRSRSMRLRFSALRLFALTPLFVALRSPPFMPFASHSDGSTTIASGEISRRATINTVFKLLHPEAHSIFQQTVLIDSTYPMCAICCLQKELYTTQKSTCSHKRVKSLHLIQEESLE